MKKIRLTTWNVNGIRACYKKGLMDFVNEYKPDILCLQETKAHKEQVEDQAKSLGYPHDVWSSAVKKGYSGVATFSKVMPASVQNTVGVTDDVKEGRILRSDYEEFVLYNIYFPNGGSGEERHAFKQNFLKELTAHVQSQLAAGREIIVVGDYNVAHTEIDLYDPVRLAKESGFLPEERHWFNEFLKLGMIDTFRHFHPNEKNRYSWWSYRELARISNRGWRIDYICVSKGLLSNLKGMEILDSVEGSDHCPVLVDLEF